jgi:hypothetical protein
MSRPLQSISGSSNNVMLKVTVPKWTGRKRKRGSDESFSYVDPASAIETSAPKRPRAKDLQRSLRDNVGKYRIEPIGRVERTHVFRGEDTSDGAELEEREVLTSDRDPRLRFLHDIQSIRHEVSRMHSSFRLYALAGPG